MPTELSAATILEPPATRVLSARLEAQRSFTVALLGLTVSLALAATWWGTGWHQAIGVPLPYRSMNLPVLWWALYGGYVVLSTRVLDLSRTALTAALAEGLLLHLHWALLFIPVHVRLDQYMGRAYQWYVLGAVAAVAAVAALRAGRQMRGLRASLLHMPFVLGVAIGIGWAAAHGLWLPAWAGAAAMAAGAAGLHGWLRRRMACWPYRSEWAWSVALVVLAVTLRLAWYGHLVRQIGLDPATGFLAASDDGQTYHAIASKIATDPSLLFSRSNPIVRLYFDPLYPLVLGLWYRLTGVHVLSGVLAQAALAGLGIWLIIRITTELSGGRRSVGLAAGLLAAVSQPLVFSSVVCGVEALYLPVLAVWVWSALRLAADMEPRRWGVWAGMASGLLLGLRRFAPLFLLVLLPWLMWARRRSGWKPVVSWLKIVGIALIIYLPIEAMYSWNGVGRLWHGGSTFEDYWTQPSPFPDVVPGNERLTTLGIHPAVGAVGALDAVAAQPAAVAKALANIVPKHLTSFFFWPPFGAFNPLILVNPLIRNEATPILEFYATMSVLLGIVQTLRRPQTRAAAILLLLTIAVQAFIHSVPTYTTTIRYSVPIRPFLIAFAACGMAMLWPMPTDRSGSA